jgi:hypothetical protein
MADCRDLKLCGMLHCHLEVCILSGQKDPIISYETWWIQEVCQVLKSLCSPILIDTGVETLNFVPCHFHLEMCILSGQVDPVMSYGGSKRDEGCEITCAYFFSSTANWRNLKLFSMLYCHL